MNSKIEHYIHHAVERHAKNNIYPLSSFFSHILKEILFPLENTFYFRGICAIKNNDHKTLLEVLTGKNPDMNIAARIEVIDKKFLIICQELLKDMRINPACCFSYPLRFAASSGNLPLLRLCLVDNRFNPADRDNYALEHAVDGGLIDVVRLLLSDPRIDPEHDDNRPIRFAAYHGYVEIVRLLLQNSRTDPTALDNEALHWAFEVGNIKVAELLLDDSRIKSVSLDFLHFAVAKNKPVFIRLLCSSQKCNINEKILLSCIKYHEPDNVTKACLMEELTANSWNKFRFFAQFAKNRQIPTDIIKEIQAPFAQLTCS